MNNKNAVIFYGNGINRAFQGDSWEALVKLVANKYECEYSYDDIKKLPFPMQIIIASDDHVDAAMRDISKELNLPICEEQTDLMKKLLEIPVDNYITTNYTFELEQESVFSPSIAEYRKKRAYTKSVTKKDKQFNLFQHYLVGENKKVWHIHGDISIPSSVIMGNYYYGKLLHEIENYVPNFMRRHGYSDKHGTPFSEYSWVDSFLSKDVYMLGFGIDLSEIDIWWLIGCKKRNFPKTNVYMYIPEKDLDAMKTALLELHGIKLIKYIPFNKDYKEYYSLVLDDLIRTIKE